MMNAERLSASLLAELHEHEEDSYRVSLRAAKRLGSGPPASALRAVAGHAGEALHELPGVARSRGVRLRRLGALLADTARRAQDVLMGQLLDHERGYRRALATMRSGLDVARLTLAAAQHEGDLELEDWCRRLVRGRERLVAGVAAELEWFVRHPTLARASRARAAVA